MNRGRALRAAALLAAIAAPALVASGPAQADSDRIDKRLWVAIGAKAPHAVVVDRFRELREDCALTAPPTIAVLTQPKVGKLTVKSAAAAGTTDPNGPYADCNGKKFNWTTVSVPVPSKESTDHAVVQATESGGDSTIYDIEIVFAKKLPAGKTSGLYEDR